MFHVLSKIALPIRVRRVASRKAGVAQLAEQRFRKPQVGGSIPLAGSKNQALAVAVVAEESGGVITVLDCR